MKVRITFDFSPDDRLVIARRDSEDELADYGDLRQWVLDVVTASLEDLHYEYERWEKYLKEEIEERLAEMIVEEIMTEAQKHKKKAKALYDEFMSGGFPLYSDAKKRGFAQRVINLASKLDTQSDDLDEQHAVMYLDVIGLRMMGDIWRRP